MKISQKTLHPMEKNIVCTGATLSFEIHDITPYCLAASKFPRLVYVCVQSSCRWSTAGECKTSARHERICHSGCFSHSGSGQKVTIRFARVDLALPTVQFMSENLRENPPRGRANLTFGMSTPIEPRSEFSAMKEPGMYICLVPRVTLPSLPALPTFFLLCQLFVPVDHQARMRT